MVAKWINQDGKFSRRLLIGSLAIHFFVILLLTTPMAESLYPILYFTESPRKSQAIVVLPAEQYLNGQPGMNSLIRIKKSVQLFRAGYADTIICAGGHHVEGYPMSLCQAMRQELLSHGIPEQAVLVVDQSQNTYNDLNHLVKHHQSRFDFNQVLFVTSSYHTYRVRKILDKMDLHGLVIAADPYQYHAYTAAERPLLLKEIVREFLALLYFKLRGYI
ncbi:MAG: YdcF family protein [Magnetococcales bacterium]|nr:YdcF family protein [Magnetococcales bacterium]